MTLYVYDHCPYCVKARMIFGLKNQAFKLKTLLNDDEKTPKSMIGVKMVPILEYQPGRFMPESLDIISYIDKLKGQPLVTEDEDPKLNNWLSKNAQNIYTLAMPRWIKADLEEFKTPESRNYFETKKTDYIGSFEEALKNSPQLIAQIEQELQVLDGFFPKSQPYFKEKLSLNDFHLFASLRSLSLVKGIKFPEKLNSYMEKLSESSKVPLYFSVAV